MVDEVGGKQDQGSFSIEVQDALLRKEKVSNNAWHKFVRNRSAVIGLIIIALMLALGIFAPVLTPFEPNKIDAFNPYLPPFTDGHLFGTDDLGRDLFTRILYGARMSVLVAVGSTAVGAVSGIIIGIVAGFFGGPLDSVLMRIMDGISAFPYLLFHQYQPWDKARSARVPGRFSLFAYQVTNEGNCLKRGVCRLLRSLLNPDIDAGLWNAGHAHVLLGLLDVAVHVAAQAPGPVSINFSQTPPLPIQCPLSTANRRGLEGHWDCMFFCKAWLRRTL